MSSVRPVRGDLAFALLEASLEAMIVFDDAGRIIFFNPAAERTFGRKASEVQGALFAEVIFAPTYQAIFLAEWEEYQRSGDASAWSERMDARGIRADGESFPCEFTLVPLVVEGAAQFAAYIRDITDRRSTEHGLRAAHEELERQVEHRTA
ncbi:MAG TPA: PAS domain S-box protein, partial [Opitutaceae bacterium]|nr:PAS domain S-box protein [Opitutaceae bacterium]